MKNWNSLLRKLVVVVVILIAGSPQHTWAEKVRGTKSGFVRTADGARIHHLEAGPRNATGPGILFVPGWTMPAWVWEQQITHFAKTHRVVAMEPRAKGESSKEAEGLHPAARVRDIKAVVEQLKLAPVVLVSWSMGVMEAGTYVEQFGTDSLAGLVLVDGVAGFENDPKAASGLLQFATPSLMDRSKATEEFVRSIYKKQQGEEYLKRVIPRALRTPTNSAVALIVGVSTRDFRPALAKIKKPLLIVVPSGSPWRRRLQTCTNASPARGWKSSQAQAMRYSWMTVRTSTPCSPSSFASSCRLTRRCRHDDEPRFLHRTVGRRSSGHVACVPRCASEQAGLSATSGVALGW